MDILYIKHNNFEAPFFQSIWHTPSKGEWEANIPVVCGFLLRFLCLEMITQACQFVVVLLEHQGFDAHTLAAKFSSLVRASTI